jgi:catechol-2,3-dioxygenase
MALKSGYALAGRDPRRTEDHMEKVKFAPRRLGHINLYVSDLERSLAFYEQTCGLARVRMESQIHAGFLSNGNTHHDIGLIEISHGEDRYGRDGTIQIQSTRGTQPGLNHLGWEMENQAELVAAYKRMKSAGLSAHALYDHIISHAVYVSDPDGNIHEFYADSMKDWQSVFNLETDTLVTSRWDPLAEEPEQAANYSNHPVIRTHGDEEVPTRHITGASFATHKYEEMKTFFLDVAGFRLVAEKTDGQKTAIFGGSCRRPDLLLTEVGQSDPVGLRLFSLIVNNTDGAATVMHAIEEAHSGQHINSEDRDALILTDPDGFNVELYRPREPRFLASLNPSELA